MARATAVATGAPDREDAVRRLRMIEDEALARGIELPDEGDGLEVLVLCCQRAPYLARLLARDPSRLERVASDPYLRRSKPAERQVAELAELLEDVESADELSSRLRVYRADELVRCGVRELSLGKPVDVGAELAHLADVCLDAAIEFHTRELVSLYGQPRYQGADGQWHDARLVVIAMGKHGGEELNFASDIDIIYVYSSDAGPDDADVTLHAFFSDLCRRVTAALGEVTDKDVVFRVDLRLRPEGTRGAIANSLPSMERYYEMWGRSWERQAWLKARACAGCLELGADVMSMMRPFVYPRSSTTDVVSEVQSLNQRIKAEARGGRDGGIALGFDVKNGVGGIREIEFFVQTLQLIWGPTRPALRTRSTIGALDALLFAGIVSEAERRSLATAYRFMRHLEHLLQLESGRQTQRLPADDGSLARVAMCLDFATGEELLEELRGHTTVVAELFATIAEDEPGPPDHIHALLSGTLDAADERAIFELLGWTDAEAAVKIMERARRLVSSPLSMSAIGAAARVAPALLTEIAASPDPDQALVYVAELAARRGTWASVWRLMDDNPALLRLLASLFGTSHYLSRQFVSHPELLDQLLLAGTASPKLSRAELTEMFDARLADIGPEDEESSWDTLAESKNAQMLRIGLSDIAGDLSPLEVCGELSAVADECLDRALTLTGDALRRKHGWPRDADGAEIGFSVLALGKLGAAELGYASDLDVVFVYRCDGESDGDRPLDAVSFFTRLAQRLMSALHTLHRGGRLYELDARLRPLGASGLLVSSFPAWKIYHQTKARLWERQALVKLRAVVGDRRLGDDVEAETAAFVYETPLERADAAASIRSMRAKIEHELATSKNDLKAGRGGLIDIEFAAQFLQLVHGRSHDALRLRRTVDVLEAAAEIGALHAETASLLVEGYEFLRSIEHRMRIVHDRSVATLPERGIELDKLARRAGYAVASALLDDVSHWRNAIRDAFERLLSSV